MQFIDLQAQYAALKEGVDQAIQAVINHGQFIMGPEVAALESELCDYLGIKHVVSCANGTDALQLAYMVYGIGKGDAVFCPDITFVASVEPACMLGATPVFCDVENNTYNICPQSLRRQIQAVKKEGKHTPRAIVAVDFLGTPADYDALSEIAKTENMLLIEDAAQSFGGHYKGRACGSMGDIATTSFFPAKPLGCYGDGGAVMTNDDEISALCRSIQVHGKGNTKYENVRIGMNSRLDTIQAAILCVKLKALRAYEMDRRQDIAKKYHEAFAGRFTLLQPKVDTLSAYAQYAFLAKDTAERNKIEAHLKEAGIPTMVYYPYPLHALGVFQDTEQYGEAFETANDYCARTLSLPMHPYLDAKTQDGIINAVLEAIK